MNHAKPFGALVVLAILALGIQGSPPAAAQPQTGNLYGSTPDSSGQGISGVTITLTGAGTSQRQMTNAEGQFRFFALAPGTYSAEAQLAGYATVNHPNINITAGSNTTITIPMALLD